MKPFFPTRIAEMIFAFVLVYFGYLQVKYADALSSRVPGFFPGDGKIWIIAFAVLFFLAAASIISNVKKTEACYLLAGVLILVAILVTGKTFKNNPAELLRDIAFAMALIIIGNRGRK